MKSSALTAIAVFAVWWLRLCTPAQAIASLVTEVLSSAQAEYAFLLNDLVPVQIAPTKAAAAAVAALTPAERSQRLIGLVYTLVVAAANDLLHSFDCGERLLLIIEDATWLDSLSCQLLHRLAEKANDCVLTWTVSRRISTIASDGSPLTMPDSKDDWTLNSVLARGGAHLRRLAISPMTSAELGRMLVKQLGCRSIHRMALKLLHARSGGNPYFAQQLGAHMLQQGLLQVVLPGAADNDGEGDGQGVVGQVDPQVAPAARGADSPAGSGAAPDSTDAVVSGEAAAAALLGPQRTDEVAAAAGPMHGRTELRLSKSVNWNTVRVPHTLERAIFAELTRVVTPAELLTLKVRCVPAMPGPAGTRKP